CERFLKDDGDGPPSGRITRLLGTRARRVHCPALNVVRSRRPRNDKSLLLFLGRRALLKIESYFPSAIRLQLADTKIEAMFRGFVVLAGVLPVFICATNRVTCSGPLWCPRCFCILFGKEFL